MGFQIQKEEGIRHLLQNMKKRLPELKALLAEVSNHWDYEDPTYRFYHQSFKVYSIQSSTQKIVTELESLVPYLKLNPDFKKIIAEGVGKKFDQSHNENWLKHTRPMLEAFFHAKHLLEMICKYAEVLDEPPQMLPSGWATVLYLYNLR